MNGETREWLEARAEVFKALGHPTRLQIATQLKSGPQSVGELTTLVGADTSTVSKHISVLRDAGIVRGVKEGTTVNYQLSCDCLGGMLDSAEAVIRKRTDRQMRALGAYTPHRMT